jgi:NADPH:quinone reductase-like Zn-dependent oxidoreductase
MNLLDYQVIRVNYALLFDWPMITGYDISSQSIAVTETVKTWKPDDKVYDFPSDLEDREVMQHITLQINPHYLTI